MIGKCWRPCNVELQLGEIKSIDDNGVDATVPATSAALRAAGVTEFGGRTDSAEDD